MRRGVRLGVDVGTVRVGVARCDPDGILAVPLETVRRQDDGGDLDRIVELAQEYSAIEIVVGLPRHMRGGEGVSAKGARRYARKLKQCCPHIRVCLVDERLTSNQAQERLRASGVPEREHRAMVDQVAAQIIVEQALEMERMSGQAPGNDVREEG